MAKAKTKKTTSKPATAKMHGAKAKSKKLQTCSSGGGPVIGVPAEHAGKWRGTLAPTGAVVPPGWSWGKTGGPECDYDRVCNKIEHRVAMPYGGFGSVPFDGGLVLVFQGPLNTSWVPTAEGGVVIRNIDDEERFGPGAMAAALKYVALVPTANWKPWPGTLTLRDGQIFFWDSAMEGADDPEAIPARDGGVAVGTPGPGTYAISTAIYEGETEDYVLNIEYVKLTRV